MKDIGSFWFRWFSIELKHWSCHENEIRTKSLCLDNEQWLWLSTSQIMNLCRKTEVNQKRFSSKTELNYVLGPTRLFRCPHLRTVIEAWRIHSHELDGSRWECDSIDIQPLSVAHRTLEQKKHRWNKVALDFLTFLFFLNDQWLFPGKQFSFRQKIFRKFADRFHLAFIDFSLRAKIKKEIALV